MAGKHTYSGVRRARAASGSSHADDEQSGRPPPGSRQAFAPEPPSRDRPWESWPAGSLPPILQPPAPPPRSTRWWRQVALLLVLAVSVSLTVLAVTGIV